MGLGIILFTVLPVFMRDVFGFKEYSKFMSYSVVFRTIGSTLGYPLLNFTYDITGSYNIVFAVFGGLSVVLLVLGLFATNLGEAWRLAAGGRNAPRLPGLCGAEGNGLKGHMR